MNKPPNLCIFCGSAGNMTAQHVFPDRLRHVVPRIHGMRSLGVTGKLVVEDRHVPYTKKKENQGSIGALTVRKVCGTCNWGWLKDMETECLPVLEDIVRGDRARIYRPHMRMLTRAALGIAMVGEWMQKDHVSTSQQEREHFRETQSPPPRWLVFMGRDGTNARSPRFLTNAATNSEVVGGEAEKLYSSFTMTIGPVLFHVITHSEELGIEPFGYARHMGLACISPQGKWFDFTALRPLSDEDILYVRNFAGDYVRSLRGH